MHRVGSSRAITQASAKPSGMSMGTSLSECTAKSARPSSKADFKLFDKQTFATHFAERAVQDLVALGGHTQNSHLATARLQQVLHVMGLPQGQAALTGSDGEVNSTQNKALIKGTS
jgi:hypothetical protein